VSGNPSGTSLAELEIIEFHDHNYNLTFLPRNFLRPALIIGIYLKSAGEAFGIDAVVARLELVPKALAL